MNIKGMLKNLLLYTVVVAVWAILAVCVKAEGVYAAEWSYTANGSGVKITKYTGSGSSVTVPAKLGGKEVNAIGDRVFANNKELVLVTLPSQNIVLGRGVFNGCSKLTTVNNSHYVTEIGTGCFAACSKLSSFTFSNSVQVLGDSTFQGTALTEVFLPSSVRSLQMKVFYNCTSLKKVTICNSDCNFNLATDTFTGTNGLTIYAPEGSTAKEYAVLKGFNYVVYKGSTSSGGASNGGGSSSSGGSSAGDVTGGDSVLESGGTEGCRHNNCKTVINSTSTCTQAGVKTYTCRDCGYVKTVTTGMTSHSYGSFVTDIRATETSAGVKSRYCTYCNHRSYITVIPATGNGSSTGNTGDSISSGGSTGSGTGSDSGSNSDISSGSSGSSDSSGNSGSNSGDNGNIGNGGASGGSSGNGLDGNGSSDGLNNGQGSNGSGSGSDGSVSDGSVSDGDSAIANGGTGGGSQLSGVENMVDTSIDTTTNVKTIPWVVIVAVLAVIFAIGAYIFKKNR